MPTENEILVEASPIANNQPSKKNQKPKYKKPKQPKAPQSNSPQNLTESTSTNASDKVVEHSKEALTHSEEDKFCTICSTEHVKHFAIGPCNHPICSTCSLRMRNKQKDRTCAICKGNLEVMIVFSVNLMKQKGENITFESFPLNLPTKLEEFDFCAPLQDCQVDIENRLIYYKCKDHYQKMEELKAITCPQKKCHMKFANHQQLLTHLQTAHDGLTLCPLCLERRPLFISEYKVMNQKELKAHYKGTNRINEGDTKHPFCEFCQDYHFDNAALYQHMQSKHHTCHLCDRTRMFRYYHNAEALREHHREEHYVCKICDRNEDIRNSDLCYSFRGLVEFGQHLKDFHNIRENSNKYFFGSNTSFTTKTVRFIELDMGSANPFPNQPGRIDSTTRVRTDNIRNGDSVTQVPPHMRVVGRITGTGTFASLTESDLALQQNIDAQSARSQRSKGANNLQKPESFPLLAPPTIKTTPIEALNSKPKPANNQSISMIEKIQKDIENTKITIRKEPERSSRSLQLAEAFGVKDTKAVCDTIVSTSSASENISLYKLKLHERIGNNIRVPSTLITTTLFPIEFVQWGKRNKLELLKLERKLDGLLNDVKTNSLQFKPMPASGRSVTHLIARYYSLQSFEYDNDPKRYVSVVKTIDSHKPLTILSHVVDHALYVPKTHPIANEDPVLVFGLVDGLPAHWAKSSERRIGSALPISFVNSAVIVGEIIILIKGLLNDFAPEITIQAIHPAGPSSFAIQFFTLREANLAASILVNYLSTTAVIPPPGSIPTSPSLLPPNDPLNTLKFYRMWTEFNPIYEEEQQQGGRDEEEYVKSFEDSTFNQDLDVEVEEEEEDEFEGDAWSDGPSSSSKAKEEIEPSKIIEDATNSWEDLGETDEWEQFLAERKKKTANVDQPKYQPPRPSKPSETGPWLRVSLPSSSTQNQPTESNTKSSEIVSDPQDHIDSDHALAIALASGEYSSLEEAKAHQQWKTSSKPSQSLNPPKSIPGTNSSKSIEAAPNQFSALIDESSDEDS